MEQKEQEVFWMVMNVATGALPQVRHSTCLKAMNEADRLAKKQPGERFVVLASVTAIEYRQELHPVHVVLKDKEVQP